MSHAMPKALLVLLGAMLALPATAEDGFAACNGCTDEQQRAMAQFVGDRMPLLRCVRAPAACPAADSATHPDPPTIHVHDFQTGSTASLRFDAARGELLPVSTLPAIGSQLLAAQQHHVAVKAMTAAAGVRDPVVELDPAFPLASAHALVGNQRSLDLVTERLSAQVRGTEPWLSIRQRLPTPWIQWLLASQLQDAVLPFQVILPDGSKATVHLKMLQTVEPLDFIHIATLIPGSLRDAAGTSIRDQVTLPDATPASP